MKIEKTLQEQELTIKLEGRLDTSTAPELETEIKGSTDEVELLVLDLEALEYISSAGLRVVLGAQKKMNAQGRMIVKNVNDTVMEIFEITGFTDVLTIELIQILKGRLYEN